MNGLPIDHIGMGETERSVVDVGGNTVVDLDGDGVVDFRYSDKTYKGDYSGTPNEIFLLNPNLGEAFLQSARRYGTINSYTPGKDQVKSAQRFLDHGISVAGKHVEDWNNRLRILDPVELLIPANSASVCGDPKINECKFSSDAGKGGVQFRFVATDPESHSAFTANVSFDADGKVTLFQLFSIEGENSYDTVMHLEGAALTRESVELIQDLISRARALKTS